MSGIWYISLEGEGGLRLVEQEDEEEVRVERVVCRTQKREELIWSPFLGVFLGSHLSHRPSRKHS